MERALEIGILGAARIAPSALVRPAAELPCVRVAAIAARDAERAAAFARRHGIARVHSSYAALLEDPELDAVYVPLPNGLHGHWTIRALDAGKHVLCEKPLAANAEEAEQMRGAAERTGRVLMEAFHWRYHPLAERLREIIASGELGRLRHVEASMCFPLPMLRDIRFDLALAGGAMMDAGCYPVSIVRFLAGAEPDVASARARSLRPGVDRAMRAELRFPNGVSGRVTASMLSSQLLAISARAVGDDGELSVLNPILPHYFHRLRVRTRKGERRERVAGPATYTAQLAAFAQAVRSGKPPPTDAAHGLANMRAIDAIYAAAGFERRAPTPFR
jgi:predicted dehydrogenase